MSGLAVYNVIGAAWSPPTAAPPDNNVATPINIGSATQDKSGTLGVDNLNVWQNTQVYNGAPTILFNDADNRNFWQHINSDVMYIIGDRDDNGNWNTDYPYPLELRLGAAAGSDVAKFSNDVWAARYCDANGGNCKSNIVDSYNNANNCVWTGYIGQWGGGTTLICPANGAIKAFGIEDNHLDVAAVRAYCCSINPPAPPVYTWQTDSWSWCVANSVCDATGWRTRTVRCLSSYGGEVSPGNCPAPQPQTTQYGCARNPSTSCGR